MRADIELGGTDQKFNLLVGRELQKQAGQTPQVILMMPLLEGLDGVNKMSKSLGNYVGISEAPRDIFGKLMSVSDELMWRYFELLSFRPGSEIAALKRSVAEGRNPRDVKVDLAQEIVARFHGAASAREALADFEARFQHGAIPEDIEEFTLPAGEGLALVQIMKQTGLTASTSEAIRMIGQGGVRVDGEKISDKQLHLPAGRTIVVQVGKRKYARVTLS
ncbi:MAG: tyrosine--tRNA ligase, partial [Rhodocyclaceae bacterium]|nr:tyrosine--tRNA ligase [Rhodocyclaceae bacterium]